MSIRLQQAYLPSQSSIHQILPLSKARENCIPTVLFCVNFSIIFKFLTKEEGKHHSLINLLNVMTHKPPILVISKTQSSLQVSFSCEYQTCSERGRFCQQYAFLQNNTTLHLPLPSWYPVIINQFHTCQINKMSLSSNIL